MTLSPPPVGLPRRALLACGAAALLARPAAAVVLPPSRKLLFEAWRSGSKIGHEEMSFVEDGDALTVTMTAKFSIGLGPITFLDYRHHGTEHWRCGRFESLETHTVENGETTHLSAKHAGDSVVVETGKLRVVAPADACPLTHWNSAILRGPLFNPQTGEIMHETVARESSQVLLANGSSAPATSYTLSGTAYLIDWYDEAGVWAGLKAKAKRDGSFVEYRRV